MATLLLSVPIPSCAQPDNIVLILTDDQRADTLQHMPRVQKILAGKGATFTQAFATTPQCCPSRASLLSSGFYPHHTRVLTNTPPNGGVTRFDDSLSLGTLLKAKGYRTAYIGKYLNGYKARAPYVPPGWDTFIVPLTKGTDWHSFRAVENGQFAEVNQYVTDYVRDKAREFIRANISKGPVFIVIATDAPHGPAIPAAQDVSLFADFVPSGPGIEETSLGDKPAWVRESASADIGKHEFARNQLRSLQSVDRLVKSVMAVVRNRKAMKRTRWIFTSDNGYLWGEHGQYYKAKPYDESIRVPLVIRVPGKARVTVNDLVVMPLDVGQTVIAWGNSWVGSEGQDLTPCINGRQCPQWNNGFLLQHFDVTDGRRVAPLWAGWLTPHFKFIYYPQTGETELYDRANDPHELESIQNPALTTGFMAELERAGMVVIEEAAPNAELGEPYIFRPTVMWGTPPYSYSITSGSLPDGLKLMNGEIKGAPSKVGAWDFTYKVKDSSVTPPHGYPQVFFRKYRITVP